MFIGIWKDSLDTDLVNCTLRTYTEIYQTFLQALRGIRTHDLSIGKVDITFSCPRESPDSVYVRHSVISIFYIATWAVLSYSLPRMCNRSRPFRLLCDTIQYFNNVSQARYCNRKQETGAGKQEVMLHCMFVIPASSSHLHTVKRSC